MAASAWPCPPSTALNLHGKEGVDGSSPSEGFRKGQQMAFCCPGAIRRTLDRPATCPQDLSPTLGPEHLLGLNRGIGRHRAPPYEGGALSSIRGWPSRTTPGMCRRAPAGRLFEPPQVFSPALTHRPAGRSAGRPSARLADVVERMRRQNLTNLPVTNSDGRLVGLLLRADAEQALEAIRSNAEAARPSA